MACLLEIPRAVTQPRSIIKTKILMEGSDGPVKMADTRNRVNGNKVSLHLPDKISFWIAGF